MVHEARLCTHLEVSVQHFRGSETEKCAKDVREYTAARIECTYVLQIDNTVASVGGRLE